MLLLDISLNRPSINDRRGTGKIMNHTYITMAYDDFVYVLQVGLYLLSNVTTSMM